MPRPSFTRPSYRKFQTPLARDLAWLIDPQFDLAPGAAPYDSYRPPLQPELALWLYQLDRGGADFQPRSGGRLGHYFEDLVAYFLCHNPTQPVVNLQRNFALRQTKAHGRGTDTLGELDFVFEQQGRIEHLEVAVKFYLGIDSDEGRLWLGPNSKDRLDKKWQRMLDHQLPLAQRLCLPTQIRSRFWLKGILFEPWQREQGVAKQNHTSCHWLRAQQLQQYFEQQQGRWCCLQKSHWLGAYCGGAPSLSAPHMAQQLQRHFATQNQGLMLLQTSQPHERRCFVVADSWPHNYAVD